MSTRFAPSLLNHALQKHWLRSAAALALAGAAPYALAADCVNGTVYTAATTCEVPSGMNVVSFSIDGGGGGAGGSYSGSGPGFIGGAGAAGSQLTGLMQVYPANGLAMVLGAGGSPGESNSGGPNVGGPGGTGDSNGGRGGGQVDGGGSGGGGGGGGATSLHVSGSAAWVRAGGGGGGGGSGGGQGAGIDFPVGDNAAAGASSFLVANATAPSLCTAAAPAAGDGGEVDPSVLDGGGGGGNGGTFAGAPSTTQQSEAANTLVAPGNAAEGGYTGDSCSSGRAESTVFAANGGVGAGGTNPSATTNTPAGAGQVVLNFSFDPARTATITAITPTGVTVQAPSVLPPGYMVSEYQETCTGSAGGSASGSVAGPASPATVALALATTEQWTCQVNATLSNAITGDTINTIPTTLVGDDAVVVPGAPTPVPVVGAAGAASLGVLGLAAWLGLRRRNKKDAA